VVFLEEYFYLQSKDSYSSLFKENAINLLQAMSHKCITSKKYPRRMRASSRVAPSEGLP